MKIFLYFLILLFLPRSISYAELSGDEILLKVDEVRNPQLDYTISVAVTSFHPKREERLVTYEVMAKGRDKTVVKALTPATEKGRTLLMRDKELWAFLPDVSKPLRVSLRERLIGEVANGDLARANFSGDYNAKIVEMQNIDNKEYYVLELVAKSDDVTYAKVLLWAEKESFWPLKAEFYTISGRLLKTCSYENYRMLGERIRPTRLVMEEPLVKGQKSVIEYDNIKIEELPEKYFAKDYMKKFMY
jgi:hypothetical protein